MLRNKTFLKILSLLIAVFLWVYVMGEVNPETKNKISNIEVSFINTDILAEQNLAVVQKKIITVDATVKGKRSDVNQVKDNGLTATVDVANCEKGSNTEDINIVLPDGVALESISAESISFKVEDRVEEEKPVEVEFLGNGEQTDLVPWAEEVEPKTVVVSGAKSSVKRISTVKGTVARTTVNESTKHVDIPLTPVTKQGDTVFCVELGSDNVQAQIQMMSVKTLPLDVSEKNIGDGLSVDEITGAESVKVVGPKDAIADIESLTGTVDLKGITSTGKCEVKVDLPQRVYLYDKENIPVAEVVLKAN